MTAGKSAIAEIQGDYISARRQTIKDPKAKAATSIQI